MSNLSDLSTNTAIPSGIGGRPRMDVVCVIDIHQTENLMHRKCALDEIKQACSSVNANIQHIQVSERGMVVSCDKNLTLIHFNFSSLKN